MDIARTNFVSNAFKALEESSSVLSSGLRINSSKDDAAGSVLSDMLRGQIAASKHSARNIGDGISMLQMADSSASKVSDAIERLRGSLMGSLNPTFGDLQGKLIEELHEELLAEIEEAISSSNFNGVNMLNGGGVTVSISTGNGSSVGIGTGNITFGLSSDDLKFDPTGSMAHMDETLEKLNSLRSGFGSKSNELENAFEMIEGQIENAVAAESRISSGDMAKSIVDLSMKQILAEAAIAMQSHSNMMDNLVLNLLR